MIQETLFPMEPKANAAASSRPKPAPVPPFEVGMRASAKSAASRWTEEQRETLHATIRRLAASGLPFTTDDVWKGSPGVPVTKGVASVLRPFVNAGLIRKTGRDVTCRRGGKHDHAQSLTEWIGA